MFLLDTNVISEERRWRKRRCAPEFSEFWESIALDDISSSVVVLGELYRGIEKVKVTDRQKFEALSVWLGGLESDLLPSKWLPIDSETARIWALLPRTQLPSPNDAWIAATAIRHGLTLVTRDDAIAATGVKLLNPWKSNK